jgi:hypothetical protein
MVFGGFLGGTGRRLRSQREFRLVQVAALVNDRGWRGDGAQRVEPG